MTVNAQCPACKAALPVVVGRKTTARVVTCACGVTYDYSAWRLGERGGHTFHKIELFPQVTR